MGMEFPEAAAPNGVGRKMPGETDRELRENEVTEADRLDEGDLREHERLPGDE